ncbi:MAG TPA: tail fiber domain-containing protein, partial [Verrucomicrobiae bacterium]
PLGILENGAVAIGTGRTVAAGNLMEVGGNAKVDGTVTATAFVGDGSGLTNLPIPATSTNAALLTGGNTFNGSQSITNGSVGIGTTSPSAPLEVRGGNQSSGIPSLVVSGPGGAMSRYVSTTGGLSWDVYAGNSNFAISRSGIDFPFTIDSTTGNSLFINKVGIGTSSPGTALQVAGTVTATAFVGDGSGLSNLPIPASSTNAALLTGGNTFNGSQSITNGSVGIGTTTPLATLEVSSPADSTRGQVISGPSGGFWSVYADVASGISGNHYLWDFKADTNSYRFGRSGVGTDFTMIYSNAFLGLGTPTPTSKLQVAGTVTATAFVGDGSGLTGVTGTSVSGVAMLTGGNTFNGAQIVTNGNVGIGTTAPLTPLEIRSSNSSRSTVFSGPGGGTWSTYDSVHSSYLWDVTGTTNQFSIAISGVGYPFYIAKSTGNVGIGTTTPQTALDVLGAGTVGPGILNDAVAMRVRSTASYGSMIALDATQLGGGDSWQLFSTGGGAGEGNGKFIIRSSNTGSEPVTVLNTGNVGIGNTSPGQLLVVGSGGAYCNGTTWVNGSDRNSKHAITAIDPQSVLQKISTMPITKWEYKVDPNGVEHIGPMAQDFHAAFGLNGGDDKHISTVDEGGVALAAIQALNQKLDEKNAEVEQLQHSVDQLTKLVDSLSKNK